MMVLIFCARKRFWQDWGEENICINVFAYENGLTFPIHVSDKKFENSIDLLHVISGDKSHYVCIKDFDRFMFHKTKNTFVRVICGFLVVKMCWQTTRKIVWTLIVHTL